MNLVSSELVPRVEAYKSISVSISLFPHIVASDYLNETVVIEEKVSVHACMDLLFQNYIRIYLCR